MPSLQRTEKAELANIEKRYGLGWDQLHAYKEIMAFPELPRQMPVSLLHAQNFSFCEGMFDGLDRCLSQGMQNETVATPYARLQICKPHYARFARCVKRRDQYVLDEVLKWEHEFVGRLSDRGKEKYADQMDLRKAYLEYRAEREPDAQKQLRFKADLDRLRQRRKQAEKEHGFRPAPR